MELGFSSTIGIIHDGSGQLQPLNDEERAVYHEMKSMEKRSFTRINAFQDNIAQGRPNQCALPRGRALPLHLRRRAGALLLATARVPRRSLEKYSVADIRREYLTEKGCAPHCTVSCVHQVSILDSWRAPQQPGTAEQTGSCRSANCVPWSSRHLRPPDGRDASFHHTATYFFGCAVGGNNPFNRKYIEAAE